MKRILFTLFVLMLGFSALHAKATKMSDVPPAQEFYVNLEPKDCDKKCLLDLLKKGEFFSFLARFKANNDEELNAKYNSFLAGVFGAYDNTEPNFAPSTSNSKIAVLIPQKTIKSYSLIVSNAILAYSANTKSKIAIEFFITQDESNIEAALDNIQRAGINYVIAAVTDNALAAISSQKYAQMFFYIPTLHASLANVKQQNILYGGIDYDGQISALLSKTEGKIASISDGSRLGNLLNRQIAKLEPNAYLSVVEGKSIDLKGLLDKTSLNDANLFINTTLLKTSLISSQLKVNDINVKKILCTQICYDPALFSLTQPSDRANMLVAISFNKIDKDLLASAKMLGIDLRYDRVAYPVMFGVEYIIKTFIDTGAKSYFSESVQNSQVAYKTHILQGTKSAFVEMQ